MITYRETSEGLCFTVRVQPGASRTKVIGEHGGALKIAIAAPPVDGKANAECIRFLAKIFGRPRTSVEILTGETARAKVVRLVGVSGKQFEERLITV